VRRPVLDVAFKLLVDCLLFVCARDPTVLSCSYWLAFCHLECRLAKSLQLLPCFCCCCCFVCLIIDITVIHANSWRCLFFSPYRSPSTASVQYLCLFEVIIPALAGGILKQRDPSVCLSVPWRSCLGYRHAGCLQLSHRRPPEICGPATIFGSNCHRRRAYRLAAPPLGAIPCIYRDCHRL